MQWISVSCQNEPNMTGWNILLSSGWLRTNGKRIIQLYSVEFVMKLIQICVSYLSYYVELQPDFLNRSGTQLRTSLKPLEHHSNMLPGGLRGGSQSSSCIDEISSLKLHEKIYELMPKWAVNIRMNIYFQRVYIFYRCVFSFRIVLQIYILHY